MTARATGSPEEQFSALTSALVGNQGVAVGSAKSGSSKGFGSSALKINDKIFAMLVNDRLVVKLPRHRVDALIERGAGERFDPGHGRVMKEWVMVEPKSDLDWLPLAREAMEFVALKR